MDKNKKVLIIGESGTGKSTSMMNLPPESTFIIASESKELPFRSKGYSIFSKENTKGNYLQTDKVSAIIRTLSYISDSRPEITEVIIDDAQYIMSNEYGRRVQEVGFKKFNDIYDGMFKLLTASNELRSDIIVYFLWHPDTMYDENGALITKAKTIGKAVDKLITIEGKFTIVLFTHVENSAKGRNYVFLTQNNGSNTGKSPIGMFQEEKIPNDLNDVSKVIREYYN